MAETAAARRTLLSEALVRALAPHRPAIALTLLVAVLYLPAVWNRDVWNPDEPRYAEVVRQMMARGEYLVPQFNGEVYAEKPPLFFWMGILGESLPFVPDGSGTRLVAVLASLGTLLLTFGLGRDLANPRAGWLAALLLATTPLFAQHASSGVIDALLTLLVTAAVRVGLAAREARSASLWAGFYVIGALAIMTKGPVGIIIPAGTLLALAVMERGWRGAVALHALWGTILMAAILVCWLLPAIGRAGEDYGRIILFRQTVGRAWNSWHHRESIDYFLRVFPASFFPWVLFLPGALIGGWRRLRGGRGSDGRPASRLGISWFLFTFLFFSLMSGKKTRYLLPLFPAASLLVALEIESLLRPPAAAEGRPSPLRWPVPFLLCAGVLAAAGLALAAAGLGPLAGAVERIKGLAPDQREAILWLTRPPGGLLLLIWGGTAAALGGAALRLSGRAPRTGAACLVAGWVALTAGAQWIATPALDALKSARPLADRVRETSGEDAPLATYRASYPGGLNLYLRRDRIDRFDAPDQVERWRARRPGALLVTPDRDYEKLAREIGGLRVIECRRVGQERACVVAVN